MMTRAIVGLTWGVLGVLGVAAASGIHINTTSSMPQGLYLQRPYTGVVRPGDAVVVCLGATEQTRRYIGHGTCPNGLEPLLKTVGAVAGDVVTLLPSGVTVNGSAIPNTATMAADEAGRPLVPYPPGTYQVPPGWVFLFSSHDPRSYDSRYLGPIQTSAVIAMGKPVFTLQ